MTEVELFMQLQPFLHSQRCPPICLLFSRSCCQSSLDMVLLEFQIRCPCGRSFHSSHHDGITNDEDLALRGRVWKHARRAQDHMELPWERVITLGLMCYAYDTEEAVPVICLPSRVQPVALNHDARLRLSQLENAVSMMAQSLQHLGDKMLSSLDRSRLDRSRSPRGNASQWLAA